MNQEKFLELRNKYPIFYYHSVNVIEELDYYKIEYFFSIPSLAEFHPSIKIYKEKIVNNDKDYIEYLAYHIGLIELLSYWKSTCSPKIVVESGSLTEEQKSWLLKLYYLGLGEFRYVNGIECEESSWLSIESTGSTTIPDISYNASGNLLAVGGGKDSAVSLELLKGQDNLCFMINPKSPGIECMEIAGYNDYLKIERVIDSELIRLNKEGFLNGHTPFSAIVAFISYLCAYLTNRKYVVLSNEGSANEATVIGTKINHQYSKTYEFESDFNDYCKKYLKLDIHYFSMLRCLNELQIAMLFSNYKKYHKAFKSCNVGSKSIPWKWCCNCPKCLFVYIILSAFLSTSDLVSIFGENLYEKEELLSTFLELLGYASTKPFECVGTYEEVRFAVSTAIQSGSTGVLLEYYKEHYSLSLDIDYRKSWNDENHIPEPFLTIVKEEIEKYVS